MVITNEQYNNLTVAEISDREQMCMFDTSIESIPNRLVVCDKIAYGRFNVVYLGDTLARLVCIGSDCKIENIVIEYDNVTRFWIEDVANKGSGSLCLICDDGVTGIILDI